MQNCYKQFILKKSRTQEETIKIIKTELIDVFKDIIKPEEDEEQKLKLYEEEMEKERKREMMELEDDDDEYVADPDNYWKR